ncbi:hypothetical protein [uncultured Tenacibaculum sp.]|uniref:hypothetical protein n=1 Tax=uncultured Tenacibaculum sp. TaxID=174713 RepID=UPI002621223B|nr:hypothetical protein [uncultured Tenacibaculum sp.]
MKLKNYILSILFVLINIVISKRYTNIPLLNFEPLLNVSNDNESCKILFQKSILFKNRSICNTSLVSENSWIGNYYVSIAHINYLTIAYKTVSCLNEMGVSLGFTSTVNVKGGDSALENMGDGFYSMPVRNINNNPKIQYADINVTISQIEISGYKKNDVDMNKQIQNSNLVLKNLGKSKQV